MEKFKINYKKNALEENYLKIKLDPKYVNLIKKVHATEKEVKTNLSSFEDSILELENCKNCKCLSECKNKIKGYVYYPQKKESTLYFGYAKCKKLKEYEQKEESLDENNELKNARMKDIDVTDKNRIELIKYLKNFYDNYD